MRCILAHLMLLLSYTHASNPIVADVSIADPHIRIFNDMAYMYAGKDGSRHPMGFKMPEWHVWRSHDLVNWDDITTILPSQTYMDDTEECWATDVVWSKEAGHYAFFFSHGGISMGVMTATSPTLADAKDVLGRPLVSSSINPDTKPGVTVTNLTRGAYDPTLLVDDLTNSTYVCFGVKDYSHKHSAVNSDYLIARLHPNLTALAEPPRRVVFLPNPLDNSTMIDDDKVSIYSLDRLQARKLLQICTNTDYCLVALSTWNPTKRAPSMCTMESTTFRLDRTTPLLPGKVGGLQV
jgi:hypothetical protein